MVTQGSNLFDSRSYCEPAQSAWESVSGGPFVARPVDAHLLRRVLKPSGVGRLGPSLFPARRPPASGGSSVRKALNDNPVAQIAVLGVAGGGRRLPAADQDGRAAAAATRPPPRRPPRRRRHAGAGDRLRRRRPLPTPAPLRRRPRRARARPRRPPAPAGALGRRVRGRARASRAGGQGLQGRQDGRPARAQAPRDRRRPAASKTSRGFAGRSDLALFVTNAGHIARYSRITQGVNVDRVPALIVLRPRHLTHGTPDGEPQLRLPGAGERRPGDPRRPLQGPERTCRTTRGSGQRPPRAARPLPGQLRSGHEDERRGLRALPGR